MIQVEAVTQPKPNGIAARAIAARDGNGSVATYIPSQGGLSVETLEFSELQIAAALPDMFDVAELEDMRDKFAAIEQYARKKQMHLPALGVQRRLEARIGQLLGNAERGSNQHSVVTEGYKVTKDDRLDFRLLARALSGAVKITDDEWRQSRRALVEMVRQRNTDEEEMTVIEAEVPTKPSQDNRPRMNIPEGMTAETLCRKGMAMEDGGMLTDDVAKELRIHVSSYRKMRDIVLLTDRGGFTKKDAALISQAVDAMNETKRVNDPWSLVEPIINRVWGNSGTSGSRIATENARMDRFEIAFGILMQGCATTGEIDLPYLSEDRAKKAIKQIGTARSALLKFADRIKRIHE